MIENLKKYVALRKTISNDFEDTSFGFKGSISNLTNTDIELLKSLEDYLTDIFILEKEKSKSVNIDTLSNFIGKSISIETSSNKLNYYEKFELFLRGNKLKINHSPYYIYEFEYFSFQEDIPVLIKRYNKNLSLISLLKSVSDYDKRIGNNSLELFFYKSGNGTTLNIDYNQIDLEKSSLLNEVNELQKHFEENADSQERKQIFKNELISILNKEGNSYTILLNNWDFIISNYKKSFELYLTNFSFDKIKTASVEYFHELTNKINQTIGKVSNSIFAIPIAYIFLIKQFDFKGESLANDFLILLLGLLFFILIWFVPFKNISESIKNIEGDIDDLKNKIKGNKVLSSIEQKLDTLKNFNLKSQKSKLRLVKIISSIILFIVLLTFFYIYWNQIFNWINNCK